MKLSDYIVDYLRHRQGVEVVFGYIGGMITHLVDSLYCNPDIRYVQSYHEQSSAFAAEGYARENGRLGVAISTSGPGATNMITGVADAYFDSVPVLYITGQVNTYEYKYLKTVRQQGFQETDVVSILKPITKYAVMVDRAEDIRYELEKACHIAMSDRKGPVLIDLPMDIQRAEIDPEKLRSFVPEDDKSEVVNINNIAELFSKAKRPMLLLGGGAHGARRETLEFLKRYPIPVVTSLMGRGATDETYPFYLGMIGSYGHRCANMGIANSDLLLAVGSRLDTRQTGAKIENFFRPDAKIVHVDIDRNELECNRLKERISINCDAGKFLKEFASSSIELQDMSGWQEYICKLKERYNQDCEIERFVENKSPYRMMQALNDISREGDVFCADIGQNQMWAAQTLKLKQGQRFVTSGGLAPMGFAIPTSVGMAFANPKCRVFAVCGDGGFHMSLQSLLLISQYDLPVNLIVINNYALGMITQFQTLYFDGRMAGAVSECGYIVPELRNIAKAYGLKYVRITESDLCSATEIFSETGLLVDYRIDGLTTVSPKLEFDKPIYMTSPLLPDSELRDNMLIDIADVRYS
ncbi:MAG: thiamine pyrophosphate-binding protein [Bacteroidales bacterium]